jgi:hypothetical protein
VRVTGLIYVILIGVWGVVLVPRWLRRHDESKAVDKSEGLEAALGSESQRTGDQLPDEIRAATWAEYARGLASVDLDQVTSGMSFTGTGASPAARRRGKIMMGLAGLLAVSVAGVLLGFLPASLAGLSTLLFAGYVSAMVYFMRRKETAATQQGAWVRASAQASAGQVMTVGDVAVDGVRVVADGSNTWEPQETTLPTYVSKTKASKIPRRIDLTSGWTGADMVAQAREQQASPDLAAQFDREWAAVEPDSDVEVERYASGHDESERYYRRAVNE